MAKVYALLVGINEYTAVGKLQGCIADIVAIEAMLRKRVANEVLEIRALHDAQATRAAIIDGFQSYLTKATAGDVALFYFCGHGSEEKAPQEWSVYAPTGTNQTIVPVDARIGDVFDLADKELSALIHGVAAGGAQVVTLFDSCHSGGATRDLGDAGVERMTPASKGRVRTMPDYLDAARALYDGSHGADTPAPAPPHIAIAACQHDETAKELPREGPRRGAFSRAFVEALDSLGATATYVDLVNVVRTKVRDRAKDQLPNLTLVGGVSGDSAFLGGHVGRRSLTVTADDAGAWWFSAGAIDGIPLPTDGNATEIAIFALDTARTATATAEPVARASVAATETDRSRLTLANGSTLDPALSYVGAIARLSVMPMHVVVAGSEAASMHAVLAPMAATYAIVNSASNTVPTITLNVGLEQTTILDPGGAPIAWMQFATTNTSAIAEACAQLSQWFATRDLAPAGSIFNGAVEIDVIQASAGETRTLTGASALPAVDGVVALTYTGAEPPRVQLRLRNTSGEKLWVALLDLSDAFDCKVLYSDWVLAGREQFALGGRTQRLRIIAALGPTAPMSTERLKVVASRTEFDASRYNLPVVATPADGGGTRGGLEEEFDGAAAASWGTSMVAVEVRR